MARKRQMFPVWHRRTFPLRRLESCSATKPNSHQQKWRHDSTACKPKVATLHSTAVLSGIRILFRAQRQRRWMTKEKLTTACPKDLPDDIFIRKGGARARSLSEGKSGLRTRRFWRSARTDGGDGVRKPAPRSRHMKPGG